MRKDQRGDILSKLKIFSSLLSIPFCCKLFHLMRYFFDTYLTYLTVCLPKAKVFELACEGLSVASERGRQWCHYAR